MDLVPFHSQRSKMKTLILLVFTVLAVNVSGYLIKVPMEYNPVTTSTVAGQPQWLHLQKTILSLFENVCATSNNSIIRRLAQEFTLEAADYLEPEVISDLQKLISSGMLPQEKIFKEFNIDHLNEFKIIYEVLYNAKNFDTFYKAAAWARQNVNCAIYVNAIYLAIQNRRDTERLYIPAPYELLPNYFINKNALIKASALLNGEELSDTETIRYEGNTYTIDANYTAMFYDNDDEPKLAYFREDIGLNSYYFLNKLKMAPWFNNDVNGSFGEKMYHLMKQLMARYDLERYANGMPEVDGIDWNFLNDIPYDPMLIYTDGNEFSHRTSSLNLPENEDLLMLKTIENNIVAVVSHMRQSGYTKTQILNHIMKIFVTGDRSYETLARRLFGKDLTNNGHASVLEHYMTSLRDPMFWKINKNIVEMIDGALKILPVYTRNELYFPGVEVVNIDVKKMTTAFDYFEFDVTDSLKVDETTFRIKIGQPRLNHKQFTIKVNISSLITQKGLVKIYLGPKVLPGELVAKKNLFILLDVFEINLKNGSNIISRSSDSMKQFSDDFMLLNTIRKKLEDAEFGLDSLTPKIIQCQIGYPSRLILPKGTPQGLPLQIFVFVAPYIKANLGGSNTKNSMELNTAILSPGYPLDLMIENHQLFGLPNAMVKYITVTQKSDNKVENYGGPGVTKTWYGTDTYDPSSRPNYNSKKGQYENNNNYELQVNDFDASANNNALESKNDDIINLDSILNLIKVSQFDYASKQKGNEPFDYRAKKAQFDKKDYSKKDYTQYRTKSNVDTNIISTTIVSDTLDTTANIEEIENMKIDEIVEINENMVTQEKETRDILEVESLPLPAMLKKEPEEEEKFDYKTKKKERDNNIKEKKNALDFLIKEAKAKSRPEKPGSEITTVASIKTYNSAESTDDFILDKDITNDIGIVTKDHITKYIYNKPKKNDFRSKNGGYLEKNKTNSEFKINYSGEHIEDVSFNKDNKKIDNTMTPYDKPTIISDDKDTVKFDGKDINDVDIVKNIVEVAHTGIEQRESDEDQTFLVEVVKHHTPTIYDHILRTLGGDYWPNKGPE